MVYFFVNLTYNKLLSFPFFFFDGKMEREVCKHLKYLLFDGENLAYAWLYSLYG